MQWKLSCTLLKLLPLYTATFPYIKLNIKLPCVLYHKV